MWTTPIFYNVTVPGIMVLGQQSQEIALQLRRGIGHCRAGELEDGLNLLSEIYDQSNSQLSESAVALSYLGYATAKCDDRGQQGLRLCKLAAKRKFYDPEVQLNLSRVHLLLGNRRKAVAALETGLKIHAEYDALLRLRDEIGFRRPPVIGFLSRDNILNQLLGRMRHSFREWWTDRKIEKSRARAEKS